MKKEQKKFIIGLTGGVGSGKSEVAARFAQFGIEILDADQFAHQLLQPGTPTFQRVVDHFGQTILNSSGTINRQALRDLIFTHPDARRFLEQQLHPAIRDKMAQKIAESQSPYIILVIPLLVENLPHPLVNRILVVDVAEPLQIARTVARDKVTPEQAQAILNNQASRAERLAYADEVINNEGNLDQLDSKVEALHRYYLSCCRTM